MQNDSGKNPPDLKDTPAVPSLDQPQKPVEPDKPTTEPPPDEPASPEPPAKAPSDTPSPSGDKPSDDKPDDEQAPADLKKKAITGAVVTLLFAGIFTAGFYYYNNILNKPEEPVQTVPSASPLPKATLTVEAPNNDQAFTISQVEVRGKTVPGGMVTGYTDTYDDAFEADSEGNFSGAIALEEGPNEITFVAFDNKYEEQEETRSVVYVREEEL